MCVKQTECFINTQHKTIKNKTSMHTQNIGIKWKRLVAERQK